MRFSRKKILAFSLTLALMLTLGVSISYAAGNTPSYTDVPEGYWGYEAITKWSTTQYGILLGYGNGKFGPEDSITAEQLAWINARILGLAEKDAKYTGSGSRALTRAEAVAIIAQAFYIDPLNSTSGAFADNADIPAQYRGYVNAMKAAGYVKGVGENRFSPNSTYTRAQALQVIYNMITDVSDKNASKVNAKENYVIRSAGAKLKDSTVDGNLIIGQGVGDGEVTLENVSVNGKLIVLGGGSNSVVVRGKSNIPSVNVYKSTGQAVRVKVEGEAVVRTVAVAENGKVIVNGAITNLVADGNTSVELQSATVVNAEVNGANVTLNVDGKSTVQSVTVDASNVKITGTGKVESVVVTSRAKSGVVVDTKGTKVTVAEGAGNVTDASGKVIAESGKASTTAGTSNTGGSSGGGSWSGGNNAGNAGGSGVGGSGVGGSGTAR